MNNSFFSRFTPSEPKFFALLQQLSAVLVTASELLPDLLQTTEQNRRMEFYRKIKEQERAGDRLSHKIFEELSRSFITPFDREDIHQLADNMDDVIDRINSCAKRIAIYNPRQNTQESFQLGEIVHHGALLIAQGMNDIESLRKHVESLKSICHELHEQENQADDLYENAIIRLFDEESDGIEIIKIKEILFELEKTTDAADRVGKVIKTILVKYA